MRVGRPIAVAILVTVLFALCALTVLAEEVSGCSATIRTVGGGN